MRVSNKELSFIKLIPHESGWAIRLPYQSRRATLETNWKDYIDLGGTGSVTLTGRAAVTATRQMLPILNGWGARQSTVDAAVALASQWNSTESAFAWSLARSRELVPKQLFGDPGSLYHLPAPIRLGLEMALHDAEEQRALEGELAELERAWMDAETIAGISDDMFVTGRVDRIIGQLKRRNPKP